MAWSQFLSAVVVGLPATGLRRASLILGDVLVGRHRDVDSLRLDHWSVSSDWLIDVLDLGDWSSNFVLDLLVLSDRHLLVTRLGDGTSNWLSCTATARR